MDTDKILTEAVEEICEMQGYSKKLTAKMIAVAKKLRSGQVSDTELDNFLIQIQQYLTRSG